MISDIPEHKYGGRSVKGQFKAAKEKEHRLIPGGGTEQGSGIPQKDGKYSEGKGVEGLLDVLKEYGIDIDFVTLKQYQMRRLGLM